LAVKFADNQDFTFYLGITLEAYEIIQKLY